MDADTTATTETPAADAAAETTTTPAAETDQSFEALVSAAVAQADSNDAQAAEAPAEDKPAGEEGAAEEKAAGEEKKPDEEPAKPVEPKEEKPTDLARRLTLVADGNRKNEVRAKELETREGKLKPLEDLAGKLRAVGSDRVAVVRELLGGQDAFDEFYLEATEAINGGDAGGEKKPARKPGEKALTLDEVSRLVAEGVQKHIEKLGAEHQQNEQAETVRTVRAALDASPERFPFTFSAPPSDRAIAVISDAILTSKGSRPSAETVLEVIENHRKERHEKAVKKAQQTPAPEKRTAAAATAQPNKTSGEKPKQPTVRGNDVPIVKSPQKSFDDEVAELANRLNRQAEA